MLECMSSLGTVKASVVIIQCHWRGYRVRRDVAVQQHAATAIQALYRGKWWIHPNSSPTIYDLIFDYEKLVLTFLSCVI